MTLEELISSLKAAASKTPGAQSYWFNYGFIKKQDILRLLESWTRQRQVLQRLLPIHMTPSQCEMTGKETFLVAVEIAAMIEEALKE